MSTRSRIGIIRLRPEGEEPPVVESIYCHFDGYPEGVGQTLLDHWTTTDRVNDLIELGDLSSLGSVIGDKHDFDKHLPGFWDDDVRAATEGMSDDEAAAYRLKIEAESPHGKGWCCAYRRDRGEEDAGSRTHPIDDWPDYGQEAEYLFDPTERRPLDVEIASRTPKDDPERFGVWRVRREALNPAGWNTVTPWEGWITIPEAIELERKSAGRLG